MRAISSSTARSGVQNRRAQGEEGVEGPEAHRLFDAEDVAVAGGAPHRRLCDLAPPIPIFVPGLRHIRELQTGSIEHVLPDVDRLDLLRHRHRTDALFPRLAVEQRHRRDRTRQERRAHRLDHVRDVLEHVLIAPARRVLHVEQEGIRKIRRRLCRERSQDLARQVSFVNITYSTFLPVLAWNSFDDLVEPLIFFRIVRLVLPHGEIGRRRQSRPSTRGQRAGERHTS